MTLRKDTAVRPATPEDVPLVNAIHRHYVLEIVITFTTEPVSDEESLANYNTVKSRGLPFIVATDGDDKNVSGYCYVSPFRGTKAGYRHSLELSLMCHPDHVRKGAGRRLLERMIDVLEHPEKWDGYFQGTRLIDFKARQLIAVMAIDIDGPGNGLKLRDWYLQRGFEERGRLKDVGWKKERWIDTVYLQLALNG